MSESVPGPSNIEKTLFAHLRSFIHLTTKAPFEDVCKSSLYILTRVPSSRHAVIEYLSTFYKVATFLHLRYNFNQKKPNYPEIQTDTKNILHINQVIDYIEVYLTELLEKPEINEFWSIELSQHLLDLIGDISQNTGITFADTNTGLTNEEIASFKLPTIPDGLEIWNSQCRPTQSILCLIQKCFTHVSVSTQLAIADLIISSSVKYSIRYDWVLCYLSPFNTELLFEKFLQAGLKEYLGFYRTDIQMVQKLSRTNAINFYALNYSNFVLEVVSKYLTNSSDEKKMFILRLSSQTPGLLTLLLNTILDQYSNDTIKQEFFDMILRNDRFYALELFNFLKQINNSVAVNDMITSVLDWLEDQDYSYNDENFNKIQNLIISFIDEMVSNIYMSQSESTTQDTQALQEQASFLKSLNSINGYSFDLIIKKIISIIKHQDQEIFKSNHELIYKLILLIGISEDSNSSIQLLTQLLKTSIPKYNDNEYVINKLRLEISPFHPECFKNSLRNAVESFKNESNVSNLKSFVNNLVILHEWDLQNQCYINHNLSILLLEANNFVTFLSQIKLSEGISLQMIEILNRIFNSNESDLGPLNLNIADLITVSNTLANHFFELLESIEDDNADQRINEINELSDLIQNIYVNQLNHQDENNPFKNLFLRIIVDRIFQVVLSPKTTLKDETEIDYYDENSNLFTKNINIINEEIMTNKSKLKAVRSSLIDYPFKRFNIKKTEFRYIKNLAVLNLLQLITNESFDIDSKLSKDGKSNLADLMVQKILLDQHFVDYQWPGSNSEDLDDNFDNEIEALKLYIERDMSVQNTFENKVDNQIVWLLLEFIADDEQAFIKASPLIRSLLASLIIQWESYQEQPTKNMAKTLGMTLRLLNIVNRSNLLKKPFCYIVDIIPLLNSFETHFLLLIVWKNLKKRIVPTVKPTNNPLILSEMNKNIEMKHLKYIFDKNIGKLAYLYPKFFQDIEV